MILNRRHGYSKPFAYFPVGQFLDAMHEKDLTGLVGEGVDSRLVEPHRILPLNSEILVCWDADIGHFVQRWAVGRFCPSGSAYSVHKEIAGYPLQVRGWVDQQGGAHMGCKPCKGFLHEIVRVFVIPHASLEVADQARGFGTIGVAKERRVGPLSGNGRRDPRVLVRRRQ